MNTSRLTPQERVDYLVRLACDAWDRTVGPTIPEHATVPAGWHALAPELRASGYGNPRATARARFAAEARERMRQAATVWGCETES